MTGASIANELVLGLGLFFLGMVLTGDNLRQLSGPSFRSLVAKPAANPVFGSVIGLGFGALMQSATAVTFILANMVKTKLINFAAATPILLWCNVGLTALAFVVTFDIHPLVAWIVGLSGIVMGFVKKPGSKAIAGVCLGVGLILFGLQSMGAGAAPLKEAAWFQDVLRLFEQNFLFAFLGGFVLAVLLQSNTGATMLVITLAKVGAVEFTIASALIYGANLGAIPLRNLLAFSQGPEARSLTRVEDVFCILSGVLMLGLFYLEQAAHIPLIHALVAHLASTENTQLALVFLLSNFLPAALLIGFSGKIAKYLQNKLPPEPEANQLPTFLNTRSLDDPSTALDSFAKEIVRLLATIKPMVIHSVAGEEEEGEPDPEFSEIAKNIDQFGLALAQKALFSRKDAHLLHTLRAEFSMVRYIEETTRSFSRGLGRSHYRHQMTAEADAMRELLEKRLQLAVKASDSLQPLDIQTLREATRKADPEFDQVRQRGLERRATESATNNLWLASLQDDFETAIWMLHRYAKTLDRKAEAFSSR